ncbi:MAG TPA: hypothetical protein VEH49_00645 [Methylomirabilota bacterium]|nr:hypothetical protein [Methylomirabilota bacterium]
MAEDKNREVPVESGAKKKPYVKPAVQSEPIYETMALACGKQSGAGGACVGAPSRS